MQHICDFSRSITDYDNRKYIQSFAVIVFAVLVVNHIYILIWDLDTCFKHILCTVSEQIILAHDCTILT